MPVSNAFPMNRTYELREFMDHLRGPVYLAGWIDPVRGLQVMPIGDEKAIQPDTIVNLVQGMFDVAVLVAAKQFLDEGNEAGAYNCLAQIADENRLRH